MPSPLSIASVRRRLERQESPRLQMTLMVAAAALFGFFADLLLLRVFMVRSMPVRYALAVSLGYLGFIALLRIWMRAHGAPASQSVAADAVDAADVGGDAADVVTDLASIGSSPSGGGGSSGGSSGGGGFSLDLDEGAVVVIVIAAVGGAAVAAGWVVYNAPDILAELCLNGMLATGLYRRWKRAAEGGDWLTIAIRRTAIPFAVVLILITIAGWALQHHVPEARTFGQAWQRVWG
jgi:hypothetical protein